MSGINGAPSAWTRRWVRRKERFWLAQAGNCWLCGQAMNKTPEHPLEATWDHIVPRSKGGAKSVGNLKLAHRRCNVLRGNRQEVHRIEQPSVQPSPARQE